MVNPQVSPQLQVTVTHSATDYVLDATSTVVRRHENGFDTATVLLEDTEAKNYIDKVVADDTIKIEQRDASESWVTIFDGIIRRVEPMLHPNLLTLQCDGAGYGLAMTVCGEEYGTQSRHASLDTIREIIKDATNGVIPLWNTKLLGTATDTGYGYTTFVEDIAGTMPYLYFPYKPCNKAINDLCDILQAIKGTNAGPHWIVDTSGHFCLTTVGAHSAAGDNPAQYWSTWWRTDQAGSTLVEGEDFLNFRFQELAKKANYVLYHGRFSEPGSGDYWTENNKALWAKNCTLTDDNTAGNYKVGSYSLKASKNTPGFMEIYYPSGANANWDTTPWGGEFNIPRFNFWAKRDSNTNDTFEVRLISTAGAYWYKQISMAVNTWNFYSLQIGNYYNRGEGYTEWATSGSPNWTEIDDIKFLIEPSADPGAMWVDGVHFSGWILRGARQSAAYSSSDPVKMKLITDEVAKGDTGIASDDSGTIGRLVYAEYLRVSSTPIVGTFTIPIANDLLPGQQIHLHAKKKSDGTFRIDKDFRAMRVIHNIDTNQGFMTVVDVTDDLKNANPRPLPTQLNVLLGAVRPEFQDRQASSIKTREIDITQSILEKSY